VYHSTLGWRVIKKKKKKKTAVGVDRGVGVFGIHARLEVRVNRARAILETRPDLLRSGTSVN